MKRYVSVVVTTIVLALAPMARTANGPDVIDTKMLAQPAVSADHVAFIYAADLWVADLDGKHVRRITGDLGRESSPAFSPDGSLIAFSAQYEGNTDVYVVPAAGGVPRRLTWHPGADIVQGFTPDGKSVLFTSARAVHTNRYTQLFTVPVAGGIEEPLPIPNAFRAKYSPGGDRVAYNPLPFAFLQWKDYRDKSQQKTMTLSAEEFIRRFLLHALPDGFQRIRYYGLLANCHRAGKLELCRQLLAAPLSDLLPQPEACRELATALTWKPPRLCPQCGAGMMVAIEVLWPCHGPVPLRVDTS